MQQWFCNGFQQLLVQILFCLSMNLTSSIFSGSLSSLLSVTIDFALQITGTFDQVADVLHLIFIN